MRAALFCLLLGLVCSGCRLTAQEYEEKHKVGFSKIEGTVLRVQGLNVNKWEHLTNGVALEVEAPGCEVRIRQSQKGEPRVFDLVTGDRIVLHRDGEDGQDYLLHSLEKNTRPEPEVNNTSDAPRDKPNAPGEDDPGSKKGK